MKAAAKRAHRKRPISSKKKQRRRGRRRAGQLWGRELKCLIILFVVHLFLFVQREKMRERETGHP